MEAGKIEPLTESMVQPQEVEPLAVSVSEAARLIGVSKSKLYLMIAAGRFGPAIIPFGRKKVIGLDELKRWIAAGAPARPEWNRLQQERQA